jgi:hypothetical protein
MRSWLWQLGHDEGEAYALRRVCSDLTEEFHPRLPARVLPAGALPERQGSLVDADRPIKVLFERQGQSLLTFIGERAEGVRVGGVDASRQVRASRRSR